jgi:hypothetical protein
VGPRRAASDSLPPSKPVRPQLLSQCHYREWPRELSNGRDFLIGSKWGMGKVAGPTRLELATSGVTGQRSNQTELRPRSTAERLENYNHSRAKMQESLLTHSRGAGAVRGSRLPYAASASALRARGDPFTRRVRAPASLVHSGSGSRSPQPSASDPCPLDPPTACSGITPAPRGCLLAGT